MTQAIRSFVASMLMSFLIISTLAIFSAQIPRANAVYPFTGRIFDRGIDKDGNGFFDYLQIKIELNISSASVYSVYASGLKNSTTSPYLVNVYDSISVYLNAGPQNLSLSLYGPTIQASRQTNLQFVDYVSISSGELGSISEMNIALSEPYSYLEFDSVRGEMEVVFKVFPNGTVDMGGTLNSTRMAYPAKGTNMSGSFGISTSGSLTTVSANGKIALPWYTKTQWPFNTSMVVSMVLEAEYLASLLRGNVTFHLLPDFPASDLTLNFEANKTRFAATGNVTVIYGTYPVYPTPLVINETVVDSLITQVDAFKGTGSGSLYNMTNGIVEMNPASSVIKTPLDSYGAKVNFNVVLDGDLVGFIAYMISGNDTSQPAYLLVTELLSNINVDVKSIEVSLTYENGQASYQATLVVQGDFNKQINDMKHTYINALANASSSYSDLTPMLFINATWLDISNLKVTYNIAEESEFLSFQGLIVSPPMDQIDSASFRLLRFFNFTVPTSPYSEESPGSGEKLRVTVQCGNNGTRTLVLTTPSPTPPPDYMFGDQTIMTWNNQSISGLKDLIFSLRYYTGVSYDGQTYPVITNSNGTVSPITFSQTDKQLSLTVEGTTSMIGFANISIPKSLLDAPSDGWTIQVGGNLITYPNYQVKETSTHTFLYFAFTFGSPVNVQITGKSAVPEFPSFVILAIFIVTTLILAVVTKAFWKNYGRRQIREKQTKL